MKHFYELSELEKRRQAIGKSYLEFLRIPMMSAGLYSLPAGSIDSQQPHKEDEIYYVVGGRARMRIGREEQSIARGSVIFVEANVEHRFYDITEDLEVLVFFAPAET